MLPVLPVEIVRLIYEFDPTFRCLYSTIIQELVYTETVETTTGCTTRIYPHTRHHLHYYRYRLVNDCYYDPQGRLHGPHKTNHWHTGHLQRLQVFHHGELLMTCCFFEDGKSLFSVTYYQNHRRYGPYISFHRDGRVRETCWFLKDKRQSWIGEP